MTIFDYEQFLGRTVERYGEVAERIAAPAGIKLIIETHSQSLASSPSLAWNICRHFDPEKVGVILDLANFHREGEIRPNLALSILKRHIDCVHIGGSRRVRTGVDAFGCEQVGFDFCAMEQADSPIPNWIKALREAGVDVPLIIEDYEPNVPSERRLGRCAALLRRILEGEQ